MRDGTGKLGVWLVGAGGDVSTTVIAGCEAIARGWAAPQGMVTARPPFDELDLCSPDAIGFGGCDVRRGSLVEAARRLQRESGLFPGDLLERIEPHLEAVAARLQPGILTGSGPAVEAMAERSHCLEVSGWEAVERVREQLREFQRQGSFERLVVVHLASTEPPGALQLPEDPEVLLERLRGHRLELPPSSLYALAAILEGHPHLNFTPSPGTALPALERLAEERGVAHMGRDGKTGETLLRTTLAPMFLARHLEVLSWAGFNILGNRDGEVLRSPEARESKIRTKDQTLSGILGDSLGESLTRIDFVRSLGDHKTAWDHVHFRGFLGAPGTLQFTWAASDSALAAPLVLDLCRLIDLAARRGAGGLVTPLAAFFKQPQGVQEQGFMAQHRMLLEWALRLR